MAGSIFAERSAAARIGRLRPQRRCARLGLLRGAPGTLARRPIVPVILQRRPHPPELLFEFRKTGIALARQRGGTTAAPPPAPLGDSPPAAVRRSASHRTRPLPEALR